MTKCSECGKSFKSVAVHKAKAHGNHLRLKRALTPVAEDDTPRTFEQVVDNYWLDMDLTQKLAILALAAQRQLAI